MCERLLGLSVALALAAVAVGGCAPVTATSPPGVSDVGDRPTAPSNFASPTDILHRYPTMRRQEL